MLFQLMPKHTFLCIFTAKPDNCIYFDGNCKQLLTGRKEPSPESCSLHPAQGKKGWNSEGTKEDKG